MTITEDTKILEELAREQELERNAVELYLKETYSLKVPEPEPPTEKELSFWKIAGVDTTLLAISALGAIAFSAIRTGQMFYIIEQLLLQEFGLNPLMTNTLSILAMIFSLLAFEGYLGGVGFFKGKNMKDARISRAGIVLSLTVIIIAGAFSGLGLVQLPQFYEFLFYTIIAVITACACGAIVYLSGENMGYGYARVDVVREEKRKQHSKDYQEWKEAGIRAYNSSKTFNIRSKKAPVPQPVRAVQQPVENSPVVEEQSKKEKVYNQINSYFINNKKLPSVRELAEIAGVSVGTAHNALTEYKRENEIL